MNEYRFFENIWVTTNLPLFEFCDQLANALELPDFDFDYENVWQWGISYLDEGKAIELNLSRMHDQGESVFEDPMRAILMVPKNAPTEWDKVRVSQLVRKLGQTIANIAKAETSYGQIRYLGGNDFTYEPKQSFTPETS